MDRQRVTHLPTITLNDFASTRASLDAGDNVPGGLIDCWDDEQQSWLLRISDALDRGERELLEAYESAYSEAWNAKTQLEAPPIAMPKPKPAEQPEFPGPDVLALPDVSIDETAEISLASIGRATLPFAAAASTPPSRAAVAIEQDNDQAGETSLGIPVVGDETLPFGDEAPDTSIDETGIIDNALLEQALREGSLPFDPDGAPAPSARATDDRPHPDVGATGFMPALSFDDPEPGADESATPLSAGGPAGGVENIDQTAFMDAIVIDDDPLPFDAAVGGGGTPNPVAAAMQPHAQAGGTKRVEISDTPLGSVMPFEPVTRLGTITIGHLTLQQLAALEVEVANGIGRIPEVLTAFHLDSTSYRALRSELLERCRSPQVKRFYEQEREAYARWRSQRSDAGR